MLGLGQHTNVLLYSVLSQYFKKAKKIIENKCVFTGWKIRHNKLKQLLKGLLLAFFPTTQLLKELEKWNGSSSDERQEILGICKKKGSVQKYEDEAKTKKIAVETRE